MTKPVAISPEPAIDAKQHATQMEQQHRERAGGGAANQHYQAMAYGEKDGPMLRAGQIMTSPVVSIQALSTVLEALNLLETSGLRHIPVLSSEHQLVGILSDRDIVRCMCSSGSVCLHCSKDKQDILIDNIMTSPVLTADINTDARHIARLFIERNIGAVPIMDENTLTGIISRSDIIGAVMNHFSLELWA